MKFRYARCSPLIVLVLLCSCVSENRPYPAQWKQIVRADDCKSVAGLYSQEGKGNAGDYLLLSYFLLPAQSEQRNDADKAADRVEITSEGTGMLTLRFLNNKEVLATRRLSEAEGTLHCGRDGVVIDSYSGRTRGSGNPLVGYEYSNVSIGKATDGALIVKKTDGEGGLAFMIVPAGGSQTRWARFPAFADGTS